MRNDAMERPECPLMYLQFDGQLDDQLGPVYQLYDTSENSSFSRLDSNGSSTDGFASNLNIGRASSHEIVSNNSLSEFLTDGHNQLMSSVSLDGSTRERQAVSRSKSVETHRPRSPRTSLVAMRRLGSHGSYEDGDTSRLSPHQQGTPKTTPPESPKLGYVTHEVGSHVSRHNLQYPLDGTGAASNSGTHRLLIIPDKTNQPGGIYLSEEQRSRFNQRRIGRHEKRYHTADAIQEIRKDMDKDSAIYKRFSWNLGTVDINIDDKSGALKSKTFSMDSLRSMPSSSGVSSTGSLHLGREDSYYEDSSGNIPLCVTNTTVPRLGTCDHTHPSKVLFHRPNTPPILTTTPAPIEHANSLDPKLPDDVMLSVSNKHVSKSMPDIAALTLTPDIQVTGDGGGVGGGTGSDSNVPRTLNHAQLLQLKRQYLLNNTMEAS